MNTLQEKLQQAISIYRQKTGVFQNLQHELLQLEGSINTLRELVEADATAVAPVVEEEKGE
jgi:hypothetical protein